LRDQAQFFQVQNLPQLAAFGIIAAPLARDEPAHV
jgi:hypothetical protein